MLLNVSLIPRCVTLRLDVMYRSRNSFPRSQKLKYVEDV